MKLRRFMISHDVTTEDMTIEMYRLRYTNKNISTKIVDTSNYVSLKQPPLVVDTSPHVHTHLSRLPAVANILFGPTTVTVGFTQYYRFIVYCCRLTIAMICLPLHSWFL